MFDKIFKLNSDLSSISGAEQCVPSCNWASEDPQIAPEFLGTILSVCGELG